jgi:hypothetical protein
MANKITVEGTDITILNHKKNDFISLTDMAKSQHQEVVIIKWLSLKNTIEYLGEWEALYNPIFNYTEFGIIKNEAGSNNFVLSVKNWIGLTAKQWRDLNSSEKGNIRDLATIQQLVVLSNLESINAMLIAQEIPQNLRLMQLNNIAITQMKSLVNNQHLKKNRGI